MKHSYSCSVVFAALLCSSGLLVADGASGHTEIKNPGSEPIDRAGTGQAVGFERPWLVPAFARDQGANATPQLISRTKMDLLRSFTGETLNWGNNRFTIPLQQESWRLDTRRSSLINALAIEWQHSVNASNVLNLSARHSDSLYSDIVVPGPSLIPKQTSSGTAATLSWSSLFGGETRVIGQFFAGDEDTKLSGYGNMDNRFIGLQVEGRYGLWRDHSPFASIKWQRNYLEMQGEKATFLSPLHRDNYSNFRAGWNWQVSPSWDVRAEANYLLPDDSVEAAELDRTQFYFSTRYGFR